MMPPMRFLPRIPFVVLIAAVALLAGASTASAKPQIFKPDQPPLSTTGAVRETRLQIIRLDHKKHPGKPYIKKASRRNAQLVRQLNTRRSKRNKQRARYLQEKLSSFSNGLIDGINNEYDRDVNRIKEEYDRDVARVKRNYKGKRKQAALRRLKRDLKDDLDRLASVRQRDLDRANDRIADTRAANNDYYKNISEREASQIKTLKQRLRKALAELRKRG